MALEVKNLPANAGDIRDLCSISGLGRSLEEGTPVFLPGKPMDRGAWQAVVHGVAKSQTGLKQFSTQNGSFFSTTNKAIASNNCADIIFLGSKITVDGDCSHEIKRHLLLGRKATTNLDSILKIRDFTLPIKVHLIKAMVFPVVMYGCESWIIKKAEH